MVIVFVSFIIGVWFVSFIASVSFNGIVILEISGTIKRTLLMVKFFPSNAVNTVEAFPAKLSAGTKVIIAFSRLIVMFPTEP
ncbi:hypothetical protein HY637_03940 [Candidatus Woesearchaeota archaeon]|nr:hypothetical protein [Candidatus Woesearchaeota archaeon]